MKLSILDQAPISSGTSAQDALKASIELAKQADKAGYTRYWIAEHHDMSGLACPAPDIMLGIIGSQTSTIRIGSGAVLLPHYKPYKVAEAYNLLATLYPNRIDLGIGRAPGGSAEATMALSTNFLENVRKMPEILDEMLQFLHSNFPKEHLYAKVAPSPVPPIPPEPWLLGTSQKSAVLAAEKGMQYAFGHFMSDQDGPLIVEKYRKMFLEHNEGNKHPKALVAVSVICAETTEEAEELALSSLIWKLKEDKGDREGVPTIKEAKAYTFTDDEKEIVQSMREKIIVGNPTKVKHKLQELKDKYQTDEFMIVTITHSYEARRKSYELIAQEIGLKKR
ncbi:LLM class flavin-dependent oxidoreductase [Virgibacillus byunsanensis]|uniref:LLM class flavin-dependent oxidoreductase n=1 Tax=Virgibacillus byunsanensis TaxID=570945 RepID=A0ABW3LLW4_9BACI